MIETLSKSERFFGACRSGLIFCRIPPLRAHGYVQAAALWLSVATSIAREFLAVVRSTPLAYQLAASRILSPYSTPCDRLLFHLGFLLGHCQTAREMVADILREAREYRAKQRGGLHA